MKFLIEGDLVVGVGSGDIVGVEAPEFAAMDLAMLRFDGETIVDVSMRTEWFVDGRGVRRIAPAPDRVALTCFIDDAIEPDGAGSWRIVSPQKALLAHAQRRRKEVEIGGFVWNGLPLASDDASQIKTAGARIKAMADPGFETTWYGADGEGVVVDAALIISMSDALLDHVDRSFACFGVIKGEIAAGTITTTAEIDAAFAAGP